MSTFILTDAGLWIGQYALAGVSNSLAVSLQADVQDATVFGAAYRARAAGLKSCGVQVEGYWDYATDLAITSGSLGAELPVTAAATTTVGNKAYIFKALSAEYQIGAAVGDMFKFSAGAQSTAPCASGLLMQNGTKTSTGNGTGQQLGAISATQTLYANIHVTAASGSSPTLDVTIESDDNAGFTTPTTRATFTQITSAGAAQKTVSGAVTDDYWRFKFTVGGGTPSFAIIGSMGIL